MSPQPVLVYSPKELRSAGAIGTRRMRLALNCFPGPSWIKENALENYLRRWSRALT
ncbi:hypothetical protein J3458_015629 [Metarhizium acridum]|uniref:uncharacterized protein n=1 Tax=Metarhizium acridum TaxID=92637 RepID=UPI001C6AD410|nr:hypothetical protein J3458_015629 [Metarhizium acridum]